MPRFSIDVKKIPAGALRVLVRTYQLTLAPFNSGCCRFAPSCSHYAEEALRTHALPRALFLVARRLLRCNPWGGEGFDPVPPVRSPKVTS